MWKTPFLREKTRKKEDHKSVSIAKRICQNHVNRILSTFLNPVFIHIVYNLWIDGSGTLYI